MILIFQTKGGNRRVSKGPYSAVRLTGELILADEAGSLIATHLPDGSLGTTGHFSSVDGVMYIDRRIFAFVDRERHDWYLKRQGYHVGTLLLKPHHA